jgi:hypothetical protein
MCGSDNHNSEIHPEVEHLGRNNKIGFEVRNLQRVGYPEDLTLGKSQNNYASKLCQSDAGKHLKYVIEFRSILR